MATSPAQARGQAPPGAQSHVPSPPNERGAWVLAIVLGTIGVLALVAALSGLLGASSPSAPASSAPPVPRAGALPAPGAAAPAYAQRAHQLGVIVGRRSAAEQSADARRFQSTQQALIAT